MILSELLAFLESIGAKPKRSLSQNFLIDPPSVGKIIELAEVKPGDAVLEIGSGPGALTKALLDAGAQVYAVELDSTFARELYRLDNGHLTVFNADFLTFPMQRLPQNIKVVANLPYHITTPILEKMFESSFSSLTIMVQKEVADRMIATGGSKTFGSLSLFVQFYSKLHSSFIVPAGCFYPRPKVDSTVIRLDSKPLPDVDPVHFFTLVHRAFQKRRKMMTSSLGLPKDDVRKALISIGIRHDARPEDLPLDKWIAFAKLIPPQPTL
jgi:16S rRNA (adenine1518-N6/adenine1519-N6)-dimethyltransferase